MYEISRQPDNEKIIQMGGTCSICPISSIAITKVCTKTQLVLQEVCSWFPVVNFCFGFDNMM